MKLLIVLTVALALLQGSQAQTSASICIDLGNYANGILPLLINGLTGLKAKFRDAIANQNITLINNQANVISNIKDPLNNRLRPLYSVKNATVRVYADLINKTTNGTASLMTALTVSIAKQRVSFQQTLFPTVDAVLQQMTDFIKAMLARIRSTLTDSNMVIYKVSGCRDTATNSLNNVFIAFSNDMRACALSYNGNDTIYRAQIDQTYKDVYNSIFNQLVNITTCASINQLSDPNSIDATTNCTRTSFALCLALSTSNSLTYQANFTNVISGYENLMSKNIDLFNKCLPTVPSNAIAAANLVVDTFLTCSTTK